MAFLLAVVAPLLLLYLFFRINDSKLLYQPPQLQSVSPKRFTEEAVKENFLRLQKHPISAQSGMPRKTGRRYIITGGAGFLGGWIVRHLVERGEDPRKIRVLDIRPPQRPDLTSGPASNVDFHRVDVADRAAVDAAFDAPWPDSSRSNDDVTVFHTAAGVRFYERHPALLHLSSRVNVIGTRHVLDAAIRTGVQVFISTSSGSVLVHRSRFWLWPWEREPPMFVQAFQDSSLPPSRHEDAFSNYAVSKIEGERLVRTANGTPSGNGKILTGCIRPCNGVYGSGGDTLAGAYLRRQKNPTWIGNIMENFTYVENASLAHLYYEARLLESDQLGGDAFCISDAGPPPTYGDVYLAISTLTDGNVTFPKMSPSAMLFISHFVEWWYLARAFLLASSSGIYRRLGLLIPPLSGDIVFLQPSLFALCQVHLLFDTSRATASPKEGGLGYTPLWTTLDGLCTLVDHHVKTGSKGEDRSPEDASLGLLPIRASHGVGQVMEKMGMDPALEN